MLIRIAVLSALARNIDDGVVEKFISIYRSDIEPPIKEACLRGLSGTSSKTAKDFLMSIAKDDRDPLMRRVALRAVSGPIRKHVMIRTRRGTIDEMDPDELSYPPLDQFPDGSDQMFFQPRAEVLDLPGNMIFNGWWLRPFGKMIFPEQSSRSGVKMPRICPYSFFKPWRLCVRF